jgi:hypothetical protein
MKPTKDPIFQEAAKTVLQQEELKSCTFKPQIRSFKSPRGANRSPPIERSLSRGAAAKVRSRELMPNTGNKFKDLYLLSIVLKNK